MINTLKTPNVSIKIFKSKKNIEIHYIIYIRKNLKTKTQDLKSKRPKKKIQSSKIFKKPKKKK